MTNGLVYLHKIKKIIHRDIKPSNILLSKTGEVKIADFGVCSKQLDSSLENKVSWVGTFMYMSVHSFPLYVQPERLAGRGYCFNSDVWSLGLMLMECSLGYYPYQSREYLWLLIGGSPAQKQIDYWKVLGSVMTMPCPKFSETSSEKFKDFITRCLDNNKETRPSSQELLVKFTFKCRTIRSWPIIRK